MKEGVATLTEKPDAECRTNIEPWRRRQTRILQRAGTPVLLVILATCCRRWGSVVGMPMMLQVKNWARYQHYKDRCPPWIKLHVRILNDPEFMSLSLADRGLLMQIWVLASENDGLVDEQVLAFRLRVLAVDLKPLIDKGFLVECKQPLAFAPCSVSVSPSVSPSSSVSEGGSGGWSIEECLAAAMPVGMPETMVREFWAHYAAV